MNSAPMLYNNDKDHYAALQQRHQYADKTKDAFKDSTIIGLTVAAQREDRETWIHARVE